MTTRFEALEWYFNDRNAPLIRDMEYSTLRRMGYTVDGEPYNAVHETKRGYLIKAIEAEASAIIDLVYPWLLEEFGTRCNRTKVEKDSRRISWEAAMWLFPEKGKKSWDWWKKYKLIFQIGVTLDWSSDEASIPALILWIWYADFDSVEPEDISILVKRRETVAKTSGFDAYKAAFGDMTRKRQGFILGEVPATRKKKGRREVRPTNDIIDALKKLLGRYQSHSRLLYRLADKIPKKRAKDE